MENLIEEISKSNQIIFGADTELTAAWLQLRYSDMLKKMLKSIVKDNVDFELSFVVREDNEPNPLEGKSSEEIWELLYGKEDLEEQKELYQKRKLKADYGESEANLVECPICGCNDVPNVDLDVNLKSRCKRILSIKIRGVKCSQCGEEYYDSIDIEIIRKITKLLDELFQLEG